MQACLFVRVMLSWDPFVDVWPQRQPGCVQVLPPSGSCWQCVFCCEMDGHADHACLEKGTNLLPVFQIFATASSPLRT
jgi:hypothetical protein